MSLNSLLVQKSTISDISWCPKSHNLNVSTNSNRLFLWSPQGASVCQVPIATSTVVIQDKSKFGSGQKKKAEKIKLDLQVLKVRWNPNGSSFAAMDKSKLVFVYPQPTVETARDDN